MHFSFVSSTEVSRIERGKANLKFQNARKHLKTPYGVMVFLHLELCLILKQILATWLGSLGDLFRMFWCDFRFVHGARTLITDYLTNLIWPCGFVLTVKMFFRILSLIIHIGTLIDSSSRTKLKSRTKLWIFNRIPVHKIQA